MSDHVLAIDSVIKNALGVLEDSKYQIFEICENARDDKTSLETELADTMKALDQIIEQVDNSEQKFKLSRVRLSEVSRDFRKYSEKDIRSAYEQATGFQLELSVQREKESNLRRRRDELQQRIRNVENTIERAETLASQMNVVFDYLSGDLNQITRILESAKNRQLIGLKIILAQEEERKRIAREIHDGAAQSLANVVLRAEIAERMIDRQEIGAVKQEISDLKGQVRGGLEEIRKIIFNLRPMALDDLGLIPTLRKYAQDFEEKSKIRSEFEVEAPKDTRLPSAMEVAIFRLVQEAFSNVYKHSEASYVSLKVTCREEVVEIEIRDNGKGFDMNAQQLQKMSGGTHFGLVGMKERVELLEGSFEIASAANEGTQIMITIPIAEKGREGHE